MTSRPRILLVEDGEIIQSGLVVVLSSQPDLPVVGEAGSGDEGVALSWQFRPT